MRNDIVDKLKPILLGPVRSEERVVYFLVEVRKLMEQADLLEAAYSTLRFFCNWIAHSRLTRGEGAAAVKAMNDIFEARLLGRRMSEEKRQELSSLFSLDTFRVQLLEFLSGRGLNVALFERPQEWAAFVRHYASVVADCPVIYEKKDLPLRLMDRVVMSIYNVDEGTLGDYRTENPFVECPFGMQWKFFKDQRHVMTWKVPMIYEDSGRKSAAGTLCHDEILQTNSRSRRTKSSKGPSESISKSKKQGRQI